MYRFVTHFAVEAFIAIADADQFIENFGINFREFILSIGIDGKDTLIVFGEGESILRPVSGGVRVRIVSGTLLGYLGCRELLNVHLFELGMVRDVDYIWMPASDVPFATAANHVSHGRR